MDLTTIAIAQDNKTYSESLVKILESFGGFQISQIAKNGKELLVQINNSLNKPDIVLMDIDMPFMNGFITTTEVLKILPNCKIIFLTAHNKESYIQKAIKCQAHGYLLKSSDVEILRDAICEVKDWGFYLNENFTYSKLIEIFPNNISLQKLKPMETDIELTDKEIQFISLLFDENTEVEISRTMNLSFRAIEKCRLNLLKKVDAKTDDGIIVFAIKHHII